MAGSLTSPRLRVFGFALFVLSVAGRSHSVEPPESGDPASHEPASTADATRLARGGAGVRVGQWNVRNLHEAADASYATSAHFEGYAQKGLDAHLVIETSLGLWIRKQEAVGEDAFGDTSRESITSYLVPAFTGVKMYPITRPGSAFEPYLGAGLGFVLGIDDRSVHASGLLSAGSGSGTSFVTGFGFRGGLGAEWMFADAFGLAAGARYEWLRFGEDLGGERTFEGLGINGGLVYRFQY
jgi:opacity protein-like surface antigen